MRVTVSKNERVTSGDGLGVKLMMKTVRKITLSPSRDIPFDKLILNHSYVRHSRTGLSVENLAEDIALVPLPEFKRTGYEVRASRRAWFSCGKNAPRHPCPARGLCRGRRSL